MKREKKTQKFRKIKERKKQTTTNNKRTNFIRKIDTVTMFCLFGKCKNMHLMMRRFCWAPFLNRTSMWSWPWPIVAQPKRSQSFWAVIPFSTPDRSHNDDNYAARNALGRIQLLCTTTMRPHSNVWCDYFFSNYDRPERRKNQLWNDERKQRMTNDEW